MMRWPRPLRQAFGAWVLLAVSGLFFVFPLRFAFAIFGAPNVLASGGIRAAIERNFWMIALLLAAPLMLLLLLGEQRADWNSWRNSISRRVKGIGAALFTWLIGGASAFAIADVVTLSTNAIVKPPIQTWALEITGTKLRASSRGCRRRLQFEDPFAPDRLLSICAHPRGPLASAEVGDLLHLTGQAGPLGITYADDGVRLVPDTRPKN